MLRYLLPVLAVLLLGGCTCSAFGCYPDIGGDPVSSGRIAADLWEGERNRTDETPTGEATSDTMEVPESMSSRTPVTHTHDQFLHFDSRLTLSLHTHGVPDRR